MATPEINDHGEISLEGHLIGSIQGFRFTLARSDGDTDAKGLASAALQVIAPEIAKRADRLAGAPNEEFVLSTDGQLRWRGEVVASLAEGDGLYAPRLIVLADESLTGPDLERVQDRLQLRHHVNTVLEPVLQLEAPADLEGTARGLAYRLYENLGLLPRQMVADDVKGLDQDVRAKLRKLGIKFGAYHIYIPLALKPAPRELALVLFALKNGGVRQPGVSELPHTVLSGRTSFQIDPEVSPKLYEVAGFKVAGRRAVRVDILERLADIIRPLIALDAKTHQGVPPVGAAEGNGFRVTVEMTSLLGTAGDDFNSILTSLGYRVRRTPKVATPAAEISSPADSTPPAEITPPVETEAQIDAVAEVAANSEAAATVEGTAEAPAEAAAEAPAVEAATADLGAAPPPVETAPAELSAAPDEEAKPAEPEFDEVWFPGGRRPDSPRHQNKRPHRGDHANGANGAEGADAARPPRRFNRDNTTARPEAGADKTAAPATSRPRFDNKRPKPFGDDKKPFEGKKKFAGKRSDEDWKQHRPREKREVTVDPDSPWAALAALRNPKPE
jgi:ATP-dependent RNA helicase SUPV3L1/SUV3